VLLFNSAVTLHPLVRQTILDLDQFLFLMVMVALGLTTPVALLREAGGAWRLISTGLAALVVSAGAAYGLVAATSAYAAAHRAGPPGSGSVLQAAAVPDGADARLFTSVGCDKCHVPALRGRHGEVRLYSDLLLHDMGPALDDKIAQGDATGADWRTTPLVALRTRERFLHDGRAATVREAILAHGGEAEIVRRRFFDLDEPEQQAIYRFLSTL